MIETLIDEQNATTVEILFKDGRKKVGVILNNLNAALTEHWNFISNNNLHAYHTNKQLQQLEIEVLSTHEITSINPHIK